jgi:hypothetical protein
MIERSRQSMAHHVLGCVGAGEPSSRLSPEASIHVRTVLASMHRCCIRTEVSPYQTNPFLISIHHQDPATVPIFSANLRYLPLTHSLTHFNQYLPTRSLSLSPIQTPLHRQHGCLHHPQRLGSDPHRHGLTCPCRRARPLVRCDRSGVLCDRHCVLCDRAHPKCGCARRVARRKGRRKPSSTA